MSTDASSPAQENDEASEHLSLCRPNVRGRAAAAASSPVGSSYRLALHALRKIEVRSGKGRV